LKIAQTKMKKYRPFVRKSNFTQSRLTFNGQHLAAIRRFKQFGDSAEIS